MIRKITIRTKILANMLLIVTVLSASLIGVQYYFAKRMAYDAASKAFHQMADKVVTVVQARDELARHTLDLMAEYPGITHAPRAHHQAELMRLLATPMRDDENIYAVYLGYGNGDLFETVNLNSDASLRKFYHVPEGSRWMVIKVFDENGTRVRHFDFFDASYRWAGHRKEPAHYTVLPRPWYRLALDHPGTVSRTEPYLFYNLKKPGITYVKQVDRNATVLALDFTLRHLGALFRSLKFAPDNEITMFTGAGKVVASSETKPETFARFARGAVDARSAGHVFAYERDGKRRLGMRMPLDPNRADGVQIGFSVDEATMLKPYLRVLPFELAAALLVMLAMLPLVRFTTERIVRPIRALMAENDKIKARRFDEVRPVPTPIVEFRQLSHSLVQMAQSIRDYQASQKRLLDGFIRLIAEAIDAKSPYTGGHCRRVPVIAEMLARAAQAKTEGAFADFRFDDAEAWEAFERGAWLHDCGKITTPEYVVDKATKLETIYNRIHEIRTRFEVLWRDAEIAYWRGRIRGEDEKVLAQALEEERGWLQEAFAFVAEANIGAESTDKNACERLREIASRTWQRHFDDRLGISEEEARRKPAQAPELPETEHLLDDKPEHRIVRENFDEESYRAQGFTTPVPELLYNRGELYNLCIPYGTLTPEERYKIQEHVIMTIKMLERLPFPEAMRRIPEYAGTHHESLDGSGYPRGLDAAQLSVPARMMAIADVFEALTAADRPYKQAKTLSESLAIMAKMVENGHLDGEVFKLFLQSGVYLEYAKKYLKPKQIDTVDMEALLLKVG